MIVDTDMESSVDKETSENDNNLATDDGRLIEQARSDPEAFSRLYRRHYEAVFRYCVHRLFERQTAEDVTSAVFLKIVEKFNSFKGTERQFRNWLYTIATNAVNNHLRKTARRSNLLKLAGEQINRVNNDIEETTAESAKKLAVLKEAMRQLKPRYQTIITLRFFENLKLTQIAEVLKSKPATVRSQLSRALKQLREKIKN